MGNSSLSLLTVTKIVGILSCMEIIFPHCGIFTWRRTGEECRIMETTRTREDPTVENLASDRLNKQSGILPGPGSTFY